MTFDKTTQLAEGISRSTVKPLDFILNSSSPGVISLEKATGLPIEILVLLFAGCVVLFIILAVLKFRPAQSDV